VRSQENSERIEVEVYVTSHKARDALVGLSAGLMLSVTILNLSYPLLPKALGSGKLSSGDRWNFAWGCGAFPRRYLSSSHSRRAHSFIRSNSFKLTVIDSGQIPKINNWVLFAESQQYTSVPEFPFSILIAAIAVSLTVVLSQRLKRDRVPLDARSPAESRAD